MSAAASKLTAVTAMSAVVAAGALLAACVPAETHTSTMTLAPIQTTSTTIAVTTAPATTIPGYYEVQRGDTLVEIATAFGLPVEAIMDLNGIVDRNAIRAGQILRLPSPDVVERSLPPTVPGQTAPTIPGPPEPVTTAPFVIETTRPTLPLPPPVPTAAPVGG